MRLRSVRSSGARIRQGNTDRRAKCRAQCLMVRDMLSVVGIDSEIDFSRKGGGGERALVQKVCDRIVEGYHWWWTPDVKNLLRVHQTRPSRVAADRPSDPMRTIRPGTRSTATARHQTSAPGERLPGGPSTHWKTPPCYAVESGHSLAPQQPLSCAKRLITSMVEDGV